MPDYLPNSQDTQALSEGDTQDSQAQRRERFIALQLTVPGLITGTQLDRKITSCRATGQSCLDLGELPAPHPEVSGGSSEPVKNHP